MSISTSAPLTPEESHNLLKRFDCLRRTTIEASEREQLRQALLQVASRSDYQMLGICADSVEQGRQALGDYTKALGYTPNSNLEAIDGPVYIKFNPKSASCYVATYTGDHRGVLVSCQSAYATGINEMYGHLPLDLFRAD